MAGELVQGQMFGVATLLPSQVRNKLFLQHWDAFQLDTAMRIRMINDNYEDQLIAFIMRYLSDEQVLHYFKDKPIPKWPLPQFNLFKRVVEEISLIYKEQANRWFEIGIDAPDAKEGMEETGSDEITKLLATPPITPPEPKIPDNGQIDSNSQTNNPSDLSNQMPPEPELPPEKTFSHDERWEEIANPDYNAMWQKINELVNTTNVVLVRPIPDITKKTGFNYHILTPDMFRPIQDPRDPSHLIGVVYSVDLTDAGTQPYAYGYYIPTNPIGATPTRLQILYFKGYIEVHQGKEIPHEPFIAEWYNDDPATLKKTPYPYFDEDGEPFLPFAVVRKETPLTGQFVNRTRGSDLVSATLMTGYMSSHWIRGFATNNMKQVWAVGAKAADMTTTMIRDPYVVQVIPMSKEFVDISVQDFQVNILDHWEAIQLFIDTAIGAYGLSRDKWKSTPVSGESLKVQNQPIIHRIQAQISHYRQAECELAEIIRNLNNTALQELSNKYAKIDPKAEFKIQFGALPFEETPMDSIDKLLSLADQNLMSKAEIALQLDPDLGTLEDAQIAMLRNKQMNKEVSSSGIPPMIPGKGPIAPNPFLDQNGQPPAPNKPPQNGKPPQGFPPKANAVPSNPNPFGGQK